MAIKGQPLPNETKEKISISRRKKFIKQGYLNSIKTREKISKTLTGRKLSTQHKKKQSEILKNKYKSGIFLGMKGKKHSEETKEKMRKSSIGKKHKPLSELGKENISKALLGRKLSRETCEKMGLSRLGNKNHNWKGGIGRRSPNSPKIKNWRKAVFERDNYTCQNCGKKGCYLEVHHKKSWANYPKLRYDLNNGLTLCLECHKQTDNYGGKKL